MIIRPLYCKKQSNFISSLILKYVNMAARAMSFTDRPICIVLGSTATGKSKLGIELAKVLNGEIISADSMQVYKGLNIITNKVTPEEQREIPHHMINIVSPPSEFTVVQFRKMAINLIEDMHTREKVPIVVGGTNYYIEALLWDFLVEDDKEHIKCTDKVLQERKYMSGTSTDYCKDDIVECDNGEIGLYERLKQVDPQRAERLHPNNVRKIARSLQIYDTMGITHTELLKNQKAKDGSSHLSGPLRFSKALVFWLRCKQDVLDLRISDRMEKMVDEGLANEISEFYRQYKLEKNHIKDIYYLGQGSTKDNTTRDTEHISINNDSNANVIESPKFDQESPGSPSKDCTCNVKATSKIPVDDSKQIDCLLSHKLYEEGLLQAIGFKEFHPFFRSSLDDKGQRERLFQDGLVKLKQRTIKYSKKQQTWVRNRFLARPSYNAPDVYDLDVTDLEKWKEKVLQKALKIASAFVHNNEIPFSPMERITHSPKSDENHKYVCEICNDKLIIGDTAWNAHRSSKKHRKQISKKRKHSSDGGEVS